jgi:hypothetical protein
MQQMSKWHELEDDASRAVALLQKLTSRKEEMRDSLPRGTEPMPRRWEACRSTLCGMTGWGQRRARQCA